MKIIPARTTFILSALTAFASSLLAIDPPAPETPIFAFSGFTLRDYNDQYLSGAGKYSEIQMDEEAGHAGGERLELLDVNAAEAFAIACMAYFPQDIREKLKLPEADGKTVIELTGGDDEMIGGFERVTIEREKSGQLYRIIASQPGGDHWIEITAGKGRTSIEQYSDLP